MGSVMCAFNSFYPSVSLYQQQIKLLSFHRLYFQIHNVVVLFNGDKETKKIRKWDFQLNSSTRKCAKLLLKIQRNKQR